MPKKRGKLSLEEENFILRNVHDLKIEEIAESLNRTVEPIKRFIAKKKLATIDTHPDAEFLNELKAMLRQRPYWKEVQSQLLDGEIDYFEKNWIRLMRQFNNDIEYSEELQMKQMLILEVLMDRGMKERKSFLVEEDRIKRDIENEYRKPSDQRDTNLIMGWQNELNRIRSSVTSYNKDHKDLLSEHKHLAKNLKATREARIKQIESGHETWPAFCRMLDNEETKRLIGEEMEFMRIAANEAQKRLSEWHEYEDGTVDQPFLNPDTVRDNK